MADSFELDSNELALSESLYEKHCRYYGIRGGVLWHRPCYFFS
ncbi:protein of unknown function [Shewanella benthica]|uniref:Uncharacterized protein n=1 Tax=Shewanella benthica TaxID=43661 RepID=A0A330LZF2_9GAMM|nr:protein of unknown function [Shewanella benthica]